ncbi:MAG: PAS domain S-box protein [Anaerolineae bacterium]|nr:PAS domain S-box protein [Anaerolineae bacterium]
MAFERFVRSEDLPYDYTIAGSVAEAKKILASQSFDVALMDHILGDGTSLDLFEAAQNMPIIVITVSSDQQIAVDVMKAGAYDFLAKDREGNYLIALPIIVTHAVERWQAQRELLQYQNHLQEMIKERTKAMLEGELRLLTIVESTPIIVFSLDIDTKFTFVAGHTEEILGYSPSDLIGKSLLLLFPDTEEAKMRFQAAYFGEKFSNDVEINGHWLSISAFAKWENESIIGIIGVVHDISERKRAELAMAQERNLLRTLLDNIPDYIFIKDRQGHLVESNGAHAAGAKLMPEEIISRTAVEVFDNAVTEQFHADDLQVMDSGLSVTNEERITTAVDGSKRFALITKVPLYDDNTREIVGLVGISRDITDRRKIDEMRLQATQLRIEIEKEREVIEMKQRFIATASHDFRTPLAVINMTAHTLETYFDRLSPEKRSQKLKQIQSQVVHMVDLLEAVLTLSKIDAGKFPFCPRLFDLKIFCDRVWEDVIGMDEQQHQHHFDFVASILQIKADEHLLQYVLVNLLSNAFKYTPEGGDVHFHIANDDQFITFKISDTGFGIPKVDLKYLFEPFYRASNVKNIQGSGLGLMIVKAYIELHGGTIAVDSEEGVGTTFTAQLPLYV